MDVFADFTARMGLVMRTLVQQGALAQMPDLARMVVEAPREASHGDLSTNAAMVLSKDLGMKPRALAELLVQALVLDADVAKVEIAGPGFINLTLRDAYWQRALQAIVLEGGRFGLGGGLGLEGRGQRVNVEYVSANPTGPMHVGHGRGAVVGDGIAGLMQAAGFDVVREYYINDAGAQVDVLARSAFLRYQEALGQDIGEIPAGLYPGDYLVSVGAALKAEFGDSLLNKPEEVWLAPVRARAIDAMMAMIRDDLAALNIRHDVFFSERSLVEGTDKVQASIDVLRAMDAVYQGRLPPPKGQLPEDWEDREQTLFRSTSYGDDVDRPLMKSDGGYTYFASDIAYHHNKYERGFALMVDVWGADHGGYVKRMQAAVTAMTGGAARLDVKLCQLVRLFRRGEPVKMSKRSGDFITLREVVDEVGADAVRFMMLMRKSDAPLDFDLAKVVEQSKDNPVFYVQYAHARAHSIYRNGLEAFADIDPQQVPDLEGLARICDEAELALIRKLCEYPKIIEGAALVAEPHRLAFYLYDVAGAFHGLWNRGKDLPQLRFINADDRQLTQARLALVRAVEVVVRSGLGVLGVHAPTEMR